MLNLVVQCSVTTEKVCLKEPVQVVLYNSYHASSKYSLKKIPLNKKEGTFPVLSRPEHARSLCNISQYSLFLCPNYQKNAPHAWEHFTY